MVLDPRKRALEQLALGGAVPFTGEVDVQTVPVELGMESPSVRNATKAPVPQALTTGDPQGASERDYYADALSEKHRRQFEQSLTGIGSGILEAVTGVGPSQESLRQRQEYAEEPLVTYLQKQKEADSARAMDLQAMRATRQATGGAALSDDPNSPESLHMQEIFAATYPQRYTPEQLRKFSARDFATLKLADKAPQIEGIEARREGQLDANVRSAADREQRGQQFAQMMGFRWADMAQEDRLALLRLADSQAGRDATAAAAATKREGELAERNVGGFDFDPANPPSADASKQMAQVAIQSKTINQGLDALERLYKASGTEIVGATAGTMGAEWKNLTDMLRNISNMGVPNGKDYEMLALQLENPTELRSLTTSKARGQAQMKAVRDQIRRLVAATAEAYKFRPSASPSAKAPPRKPAASVLPKDAGGQPTLDAPKPAKVQYSPSRDMTRELDASGNVIREYKGRPNG